MTGLWLRFRSEKKLIYHAYLTGDEALQSSAPLTEVTGVGNEQLQPSSPLAEDAGVGNEPLQPTASLAEGAGLAQSNSHQEEDASEGMDRPLFSPALPFSKKKVLIEETDYPLPPTPPGKLVVTSC